MTSCRAIEQLTNDHLNIDHLPPTTDRLTNQFSTDYKPPSKIFLIKKFASSFILMFDVYDVIDTFYFSAMFFRFL